MLVSSPKYQVQDVTRSLYEAKMSLTVRSFQKEDVGSYRCIAKNSLGEVDSSIRLYGNKTIILIFFMIIPLPFISEIPGRNRKMYTTKFSNNEVTKDSYKQGKLKVSFPPDDEEQQYGSTEDLNDVSDSSINSNKQSNVQGKVGTIKFVTPRSPIDHSNSVNGVGTSGGYMGVNVHLNKQFPSIDIVTRNPFVIPTIRTGVDGPDGINGHSYGHSTASKKSLSCITSFSIIFFLLVSLQITIQTD